MGLAHYIFALFVFILACLFMLLCKYLFGRTKNHLQALDEKEKKLLALYSTLEDMMDEFNDSALQANSEFGHHITEMRNVVASLRNSPAETPAVQPVRQAPAAAPAAPQPKLPAQNTVARQRAAVSPRQNPVVNSFDAPLFEVIGEAPAPAAKTRQPEADRPARILALHKNGMDRLHIAKELSVTISEVDLVLGIAGQGR